MTIQETTKILSYFRELYPNGEKATNATVNAWHTVIGEYDFEVAWECAMDLAKEWDAYTMPPPAALVKRIRSVLPTDMTAIELWREAERLIRRGLVLTEEEFSKAPEPIRVYFGGRSAIRDMALLSAEELPYERARFLKNIAPIIERASVMEALSDEAKKAIASGNYVKALAERMN